MSKHKVLSWISNVCFVAGFVIPFVASGFVGMSLYKRPGITILNAVLWIAGLILSYLSHLEEKKYPAATPAWIRVASFITGTPATIVFLGLIWGYIYYPTMQTSAFVTWVNVPLILSLFVCGIMINKSHWLHIIKHPAVVGYTVLLRWVVPAAIAYVLGHLILSRFMPQPAGNILSIGMLVLATTPTGPASNTMTLISRGELALSVSVTAINNIIAPFLQPILLTILGASFVGHIDSSSIFKELMEIALAPVIIGSIVGGYFPEQIKKIRPALGAIAVICLTFIMLANISKGSGTLLKQLWILPWMLGACAVQAMGCLTAGFYLSKYLGFTMKERVAATFNVAVENASLATVVAINHFGVLAALPAVFYGKLQHVFGIGVFVRKFQNMPELMEEEEPVAKPEPELANVR